MSPPFDIHDLFPQMIEKSDSKWLSLATAPILGQPPAVLLMGPTGVGKTALAVDLVSRLPFSIVSVDSAMIYRGMDIGTAKPSEDELTRAPHRLINICDPTDVYSAARFRDDALGEMQDIVRRGKIPLLVGGTGLYFRALEQGLADLPSADPEVRQRLQRQADKQGWAPLHRRLRDIDPEAAGRIHPNDPQRIQRALEVWETSGRTMTELLSARKPPGFPYRPIKIALFPKDREGLRVRLRLRFLEMLARGLVDEVQDLRRNGMLLPGTPAARLVGYREVNEYLSGRIDLDTMKQRAVISTRQLAKRQLTWFGSEPGLKRFDCEGRSLFDGALKFLEETSKDLA